MRRAAWLIEHRRFGAYLGTGEHPRSGKTVPLYRADDARKPAVLFGTMRAAQGEIERIAEDRRPFAILALNH